MKKFLIIFSIIVAFFLLLFVSLLLYISHMAGQNTKVKSDVILVLGGNVYDGTSCYGPICQQKSFVPNHGLNPCLVARVDQAVSLYKDHYAPKVLMSGGNDKEDNANEAENMKKIATEAGVPASDILMEKNLLQHTKTSYFLKKYLLKQVYIQSS